MQAVLHRWADGGDRATRRRGRGRVAEAYEDASRSSLAIELTRLCAVVLIVALAAWFLTAVAYPSPALLLLVCGGEAGLAAAYYVTASAPRAAAALVTVLGTLVAVGLVALATEPLALVLLVTPVLLAAFLIEAWLAPLTAGALFVAAAASGALSGQQLTWLALGMALPGVLAWLTFRTLRLDLESSWRLSASASQLMRDLQERQEELNKTMKNLQLTNHLLQSTNRELELARREADEARQLKARFAASVSHELRTPLSIILGFTEIMTRSPEVYGDVVQSRKLCRDIAEVRRAARYLSDLVDDILDLARIDALKMPVNRQPSSIAEVIEEAAATVRPLLEGRPVVLRTIVPPGLPRVSFDRGRICQVLLNLLTNAARFTAEGSITVSAEWRERELLVAVSDTGTGVSADELERIFDDYYQLGNCGHDSHGGKGLGLAIAKRMIQLHEGTIWCESKPGHGTRFCFTLPTSPRRTSYLVRGEEARLPKNPYPPCVVVVDDCPLSATYLRRRLDGYHVHHASDHEQLLALVKERRPHAVVVNVPLTGPHPNASLAEDLPAGLPVISLALPSLAWLGPEGPFDACLAKPVSPYSLVSQAESLGTTGDALIVDDDRGFVSLMRRAFESALPSWTVRCAYCEEEALQLVRQHRPAIAFVDILMPGSDGYQLAGTIRRQCAGQPIRLVAVTGASLGEDVISRRGQELSVHLGRGFQGDELVGVLQGLMASIGSDHLSPAESAIGGGVVLSEASAESSV